MSSSILTTVNGLPIVQQKASQSQFTNHSWRLECLKEVALLLHTELTVQLESRKYENITEQLVSPS